MIEAIRSVGQCNHTNTEYDNLTGYVTHTYSMEWDDRDGTRWRKTCTVINLGRPDRGIVGDVDAAMREEPLPYESKQLNANYRASIVANVERKNREAMEAFVAHFHQHGPQPMAKLLDVSMWGDKTSISKHFRDFPEVYRCFPGTPQHWGLHGQKPPEARKEYGGLIAVMREALTELGPMTSNELADVIGCKRVTCRTSLGHYDDVFTRVKRIPSGKQPLIVWGVKGVHDV